MCLRKVRVLSPLKYIDVVRRTNTTLDVLQESQWTDFTQFTFGYCSTSTICVVWERLTNIQATARPEKYGQEFGRICRGNHSKKKNSSGQKKSRSSTMHESYEEFCYIDPIDKKFDKTMKKCAREVGIADGF